MSTATLRPARRHDARPYSETDCAYIRAQYQDTPKAKMLAALPGRSWYSVAAKAHQLGVSGRYYGPQCWRAEEDALLRARYPLEGAECIATLTGRTLLSVHKRACRLKIARRHVASDAIGVRQSDLRYTPAEQATLRALYEFAPMPELQAALPGRSSKAIAKQARLLGLSRHFRHWPPAHEALLREHYPTQGPTFVAALIGKSRSQVTSKASALQVAYRPAKPEVAAKPKRQLKLQVPPKPAKQVLAAPVPKALPVAGAASAGSLATPRLNARKDQRQREERARAKDFSITAALKAEAPDSEGRRIYTVAARQGGQAGIAAFLSWKQQQAA